MPVLNNMLLSVHAFQYIQNGGITYEGRCGKKPKDSFRDLKIDF